MSTPPTATNPHDALDRDFVRDDALDREQRALLRKYLTPRRALDGSIVWLLDELEHCDEAASSR